MSNDPHEGFHTEQRWPGQLDPMSDLALARAERVILPFPMAARIGKVRDVARKLVATNTLGRAAYYRGQVTGAVRVHLRAKHIPADCHAKQISEFWRAVDLEVARILYMTRRDGDVG